MPTRATRVPTRSRRTRRSRAARTRAATVTCSSSTATTGCSTSCSTPTGCPPGGWHAGSGAVFRLGSNALRPAGWTCADAAGLPILPGLVRYDEVAAGHIDHALRFTVSRTRNAYVAPARHAASSNTSTALPPMGMRVRLKAGFDLSHYPAQARVMLQALKTYGMIVADNGSDWYLSGTADRRWNDDAINTLKQVPRQRLRGRRDGTGHQGLTRSQTRAAWCAARSPAPDRGRRAEARRARIASGHLDR